MTNSTSVPKKSLARTMVRLNGWSKDDAIREIAHYDGVDDQEAERRYHAAQRQRINQIVGQGRCYDREQRQKAEALELTLAIAYYHNQFLFAKDLTNVSFTVGWGLTPGIHSTGRVMKEIAMPLECEGLFENMFDKDGKCVGYQLSATGMTLCQELFGERLLSTTSPNDER